MANPLGTKQITAMSTIATHTTIVNKRIDLNMNSFMGSIEATNIASTRSVLITLQMRGFIAIKGDIKDESVHIILTSEGSAYLASKESFQESSVKIDKIIAGEEEQEVIEPVIEPIAELIAVKPAKVVKVKQVKEPKIKAVKVAKERVEHRDEDGNLCPKKGDDEKGSKSWNVYQFLRMPNEEGLSPSNKLVETRMKELGGFHTVYYSEIERVRQNYTITLKK